MLECKWKIMLSDSGKFENSYIYRNVSIQERNTIKTLFTELKESLNFEYFEKYEHYEDEENEIFSIVLRLKNEETNISTGIITPEIDDRIKRDWISRNRE